VKILSLFAVLVGLPLLGFTIFGDNGNFTFSLLQQGK
jgi:hypothetical protein